MIAFLRSPVWFGAVNAVLFSALAGLAIHARRNNQRLDWFRMLTTATLGAIFLTLPVTITAYRRIQAARESIRRLENGPIRVRVRSQGGTSKAKESRYAAQPTPPDRLHAD